MKPVFERFRGQFIGKCSPVHFFLGRLRPCGHAFFRRAGAGAAGADSITRESYSHAVISHGFWPGSGAVKDPAF